MGRWLRTILAWLAGAAATVLAASLVHSLAVQAGLTALGVELPAGLRLTAWAGDLAGLAPALFGVLGGALAIGLVVAVLLKPRLPALAGIAEPLAGAAAVAVALWAMHLNFATTPLASARTTAGFLALCAAGALGGWVFARVMRRRA